MYFTENHSIFIVFSSANRHYLTSNNLFRNNIFKRYWQAPKSDAPLHCNADAGQQAFFNGLNKLTFNLLVFDLQVVNPDIPLCMQ